MPLRKTPSEAMAAYLLSVKAAVNQITDPSTGKPVQIPDFEILYNAAKGLDYSQYPTEAAFVIAALLGRAADYDFVSPGSDYPLSFPDDHHLHPTMGAEWYWVGCHLQVTDPFGNPGRLGVLVSTQKTRCMGITEQLAAGYTDRDVLLCGNIVTVTIDMDGADKSIVRRNPNLQWPLVGGVISYSSPGDDSFWFKCGRDAIWGTSDVLPMNILVDDGDNIQMNLQLSAMPQVTGQPFFLQGPPELSGNGGTGITTLPSPGIYYSWPQLNVTGTILVQGIRYTISSGTGWIDHQLLMKSLENPNGAASPVPFIDDPKPYNGWTWQFYNLDNGDAFTGASFIIGEMNDKPPIDYAYYLRLTEGDWKAYFMLGGNQLSNFIAFPVPAGHPDPKNPKVSIPVDRSYQNLNTIYPLVKLQGTATPWFYDGTFNNSNGSIAAENPADYTDTSGAANNGHGFLEAVGLEQVENYRKRAIRFLEVSCLAL